MSKVIEVNKTEAPIPSAPPSQTKAKNKTIAVLRAQSRLTEVTIEELETKYSKKFGCKVVILEPNLEMVDYING